MIFNSKGVFSLFFPKNAGRYEQFPFLLVSHAKLPIIYWHWGVFGAPYRFGLQARSILDCIYKSFIRIIIINMKEGGALAGKNDVCCNNLFCITKKVVGGWNGRG